MRARGRTLLILGALLAAGVARADLPLPLQDGEKLSYRVSWAIVPGAGEIKISAQQDPSAPRLIVSTSTATRGVAKWLMEFRADSQSVFDLETGKLLWLRDTSTTRDKRVEHTVAFNYEKREADYVAIAGDKKSQTLKIPAGDPTDLIMGLLQTRSWDLKPGEKRDALVIFDHEFYELTIHMARYEDVRTPMGMFKTIVMEPRMDKTPPKGMFKRGAAVRVWIAQDANRLPVKFEVVFNIGTGTATLESYDPPPARSSSAVSLPNPSNVPAVGANGSK
jgi:hypothetical protein